MAAVFKVARIITRNALLHHSRFQVRLLCQAGNDGILKRTALYDFHLSHGGKMVPFAGWSMPVQYEDTSIINSSLHTRQNSSLFDVSHMLQMEFTGRDAEQYLEHLVPADVANLKEGAATLSMFTTSSGGIIDDCIITRTGETSFFVVSNAGRADVDFNHIQNELKTFKGGSSDISITPLINNSLIALQGPKSVSVLQEGVRGDLTQLKFMKSTIMDVFSISQCRVSRCGYTGEDGFEISVPTSHVLTLVNQLLSKDVVKLAGLGARDVLRLEAGLCLYGNDISEDTTPIEAGLAWCIGKRRRQGGGFLGAEPILKQLKEKPDRRRIGLTSDTGPPARQGCQVLDDTGNPIGVITSGSPSPTLKYNIAMAYVPRGLSKVGTELNVQIRKRNVKAKVVKMPFVPSNYYY